MTRRSAAETREHVLQVAHELFYAGGIHATGIDKVAAEAGVAPTTLYRQFASKDDLVDAYIERADHITRAAIDAAIAAAAGPRAAVLAVFDEQLRQVTQDGYRGCACQMALAEYPGQRRAVAAKDWLRQRFRDLLTVHGVRDGNALADRLTLVYEGALAAAQSLGADGPVAQARPLAEMLLDAHGVS